MMSTRRTRRSLNDDIDMSAELVAAGEDVTLYIPPPPLDENGDTDEDSGAEDESGDPSISNVSRNMLEAEAEEVIQGPSTDDGTELSDNKKQKKKKKKYNCVKGGVQYTMAYYKHTSHYAT